MAIELKLIFIINLFNNYVVESRQGLGAGTSKNLKSNLIKPWNFLPQPSFPTHWPYRHPAAMGCGTPGPRGPFYVIYILVYIHVKC